MTATEAPAALLDRVRKLLAKAEAEGVTAHEAEALNGKAAELMARYGIDRAMLAASGKVEDKPGSRIIYIPNPYAGVRSSLLGALATAMRCTPILLGPKDEVIRERVHIFGYASDLERLDLLYTSVLVQMAAAFAAVVPPPGVSRVRAWNRSWLLGYCYAVATRVREAEERAAANAATTDRASGPGTALVLADRSLVIRRNADEAYPFTRKKRTTYSGSGYQDGHAKGQQADIGQGRVGSRPALAR